MTDELQAALARAERAEAEVKRLKLETLRANNEKKRADHYEAQASEARTAGAEAMREALETALRKICDGPRDVEKSYAELFAEVCAEARAALAEKEEK